MLIDEIISEGARQIFGRSGNKVVRKYRCTSGTRKGRIVAKPSTCSAPLNIKSSVTMKKTRRRKSPIQSIKTKRTKTYNPASRRIARANKPKRSRGKKI